MIKLSLKIDLSLGKILLGFAGISVSVCAYKLYSTKENKEVTCLTDENDYLSDLNPKNSSIKSENISVKPALSSFIKVVSVAKPNVNDCKKQRVKFDTTSNSVKTNSSISHTNLNVSGSVENIDNNSMKSVQRVVKTHVDENKIKESPLRKIKTVKKNNKVGIKRQITSDTSDSNFTKDENIANIDGISSIDASNVEKSYLDEIKNAVSYVKKVNTNNEIQATDFEISTTPKTVDKNVIEGCQMQESLKADADLAITKENSGQIRGKKIEAFKNVVDFQN